jgi:hypothetical protein
MKKDNMIEDNVICSDTLKTIDKCKCLKCKKALKLVFSNDEVPEDGTDQAKIFDEAVAHLIFPPRPGESFDDIINNAQK